MAGVVPVPVPVPGEGEGGYPPMVRLGVEGKEEVGLVIVGEPEPAAP